MSERVKHPGYSQAITPTHDWDNPPGPFHWAVYRPLDSGMAERIEGFSETLDDAYEAAEAAFSGGDK